MIKFIACLVLVAVAWADEDSSSAPSAQPPAPAPSDATASVIKLGNVRFTGTLRSRLYVWNWFQAPTGQNQYAYSGNLLRLNFEELGATFDWDAEFAVPFLLGLPKNATEAAPQGALGLGSNYYTANGGHQNTAMIFPKQLYVRFHEGDVQKLQVGRFVFLDGSELAPEDPTLAVLKQTRMAARLLGDFGFSDVGRSFDGVHYSYSLPSDNFTFVAAVPTRGVFQVDGWGWNRIGFGYAAYTHESAKGRLTSDSRIFELEYDDFRHILKTDNRHGTFFQVLPTPRLYARFPFFNMMNMQDGFLSLILRPHAKVTISSEFHSLRLSNANDLWYSGGGAYQPWSFGYTGRSTSGERSLANLYDTNVEYRVSRLLTLTTYLGYAQGLAAIEKIYPKGTGGELGLLEGLFRF